jgi:hypothetical protein
MSFLKFVKSKKIETGWNRQQKDKGNKKRKQEGANKRMGWKLSDDARMSRKVTVVAWPIPTRLISHDLPYHEEVPSHSHSSVFLHHSSLLAAAVAKNA